MTGTSTTADGPWGPVPSGERWGPVPSGER